MQMVSHCNSVFFGGHCTSWRNLIRCTSHICGLSLTRVPLAISLFWNIFCGEGATLLSYDVICTYHGTISPGIIQHSSQALLSAHWHFQTENCCHHCPWWQQPLSVNYTSGATKNNKNIIFKSTLWIQPQISHSWLPTWCADHQSQWPHIYL